MLNQQEVRGRMKWMLLEAVILVVLALPWHFYWAALGIGIGAAAGILNYWSVTQVVANPSSPRGKKGGSNQILQRYLLRLLIGGTLIIVTGVINTGLLFGVIIGLTLEMQTYLWEAGKQIFS